MAASEPAWATDPGEPATLLGPVALAAVWVVLAADGSARLRATLGVAFCLRWSTTTGAGGGGVAAVGAVVLGAGAVVAGAVLVGVVLAGCVDVDSGVVVVGDAGCVVVPSAAGVVPVCVSAPTATLTSGPPRLAAVNPPPASADSTVRSARRRALLICPIG